jgi:hypothetical protein
LPAPPSQAPQTNCGPSGGTASRNHVLTIAGIGGRVVRGLSIRNTVAGGSAGAVLAFLRDLRVFIITSAGAIWTSGADLFFRLIREICRAAASCLSPPQSPSILYCGGLYYLRYCHGESAARRRVAPSVPALIPVRPPFRRYGAKPCGPRSRRPLFLRQGSCCSNTESLLWSGWLPGLAYLGREFLASQKN